MMCKEDRHGVQPIQPAIHHKQSLEESDNASVHKSYPVPIFCIPFKPGAKYFAPPLVTTPLVLAMTSRGRSITNYKDMVLPRP